MNNKKIYKDSIIYFSGSIAVAILGFIVSLLYSYLFTPEEYGIHSLAASTYMLLSQFFGLWLSTGILRFHEKYKNENKSDIFYSSIYITQFVISLIFVFLLNVGAWCISKELLFKEIFFIYSIIYFFEYNILVFNTYLRCNLSVKKYNLNIMANNALKIIVLLVMIIVFRMKSVIIISISILVTEAIQFFYFLVKYKLYRHYNIEKFNYNIMKKTYVYAFPLIGTTITSWILNVSDRYIIKILGNSHDVGLYSYAYLLGNNLFWLLANFIMLGAYPNFVKLFEKNEIENLKQLFKKYINMYCLMIFPCCFGVIAISKLLFTIITSEMYHESYGVFIYTGIGISVLGLCQFINKIFELYRKTKIILVLNVICAVFNIIFNIIFIYEWGYIGGAISTMLSYILYFVLALIISRKYLSIPWDYKNIAKYFFGSVIMYVIIVIAQHFLKFNSNIINLIVYVFIGMLTYFIVLVLCGGINKNSIKDILKIIKRD